MATTDNKSANSGTEKTVAEMAAWYEANKQNVANFAKADSAAINLRDVTKSSSRNITSINKSDLLNWIKSPGSNEKNLRNTARYLYYRSNIFYRLVNWYADMWALNCRKVVPAYDLVKGGDTKKMLKSYNDTLDVLDRLKVQTNMVEVLTCVYLEDVYYGIRYTDETGTFFYRLEPDECIIDSRYMTSDFGFAVDMSKWKSAQRQQIIEYLGSPLKEMYSEYERTNVKYIHCPDEYSVCFKFRTDLWDTPIPPLLEIFLQLSSLEELTSLQAESDALSTYKLIYLPMKVHTNTNDIDDFLIDPAMMHKYFKRMLDDGAVPDGAAAAIIPGDELKTIDFSRTVDGDVNSAQKAQSQLLSTSGGGAVIDSSNITSTAAFEAWLEAETQFALSTLIGQINGAVNRWISYELKNAAKVEFFEVSCYTQKKLAEQLLESCKYSFSNRLAYNTCLGISEKETMAMEFLEAQVLGLPGLMNHPLSSSFTQSGESDGATDEGGAPEKDASELTESGERDRNR